MLGPAVHTSRFVHFRYCRRPHHDHSDISRLAAALRLPKLFPLSNKKGHIDRRLALSMLLMWLAFPVRQENDMEEFFRRDRRFINA